MNIIVDVVIGVLVYMINGCYAVWRNYWIAIFLFTFLTKLFLLPLSVWVQKNSIKTVQMQPEINHIKAMYWGSGDKISEEQYKLFKREKYNPFVNLIPLFVQLALLMGVVEVIKRGTDLTAVPAEVKGVTLLMPFVAALSALFLCYVQNRANVLQVEQGNFNKYGTLIFSVALSLYLGFFVSIGVGIYWVYSNLLSVVQLILLNAWIDPKKHINYDALNRSKEELRQAKLYVTPKKKADRNNPYRKKEKEDYKKFFSGTKKRIVFYSEKNGFYKYYKNIIEEIIRRTNIVIHYITSDPEDEVFSLESEQFKIYYIGENRLVVLMMKLETDIMVMTTPDLENFQLKRSYVKTDIEYIYVPHDVNSANLTFHKNALDHFDTIFASGPKNKAEILEREQKYALPQKKIVEWGSGVIDNMRKAYKVMCEAGEKNDERKSILIAPSWQRDNIMDSCIEEILDELKDGAYRIIVRPHPQYVRHFENRIDILKQKYGDRVEIQKDFSSNRTVYMSDLLITDWSSIAFEYSFSTLKPVLFIDTPMKVVNEDYAELSTVPIDIELRDKIGISVARTEFRKLAKVVNTLLYDKCFAKESLEELRAQYIYNVGNSGQIGAKYIIQSLIDKAEGK